LRNTSTPVRAKRAHSTFRNLAPLQIFHKNQVKGKSTLLLIFAPMSVGGDQAAFAFLLRLAACASSSVVSQIPREGKKLPSLGIYSNACQS